MKKFFLSLLLCVSFLMYGCSYDTYEIGTEMKVAYVRVNPNEWTAAETPSGKYIFKEISMADITADVMDNGAVLVYFIDESERDNILPYVFPVPVGPTQLVLQNIRYVVGVGKLGLVVEWEDGYDYSLTEPYEFKVCIMSPGKSKKK